MVKKVEELDDSGSVRPKRNPELRKALEELAKVEARPSGLDRSQTQRFYFNTKAVVAEAEKINDQCIILYHRNDQFWQMGNVSALIFYYRIRPFLGLTNVKLNMDNDYCRTKWKYGHVMVGRIDDTVTRLQKECECKMVVNTTEIKVLILPKKLDAEEIDIWIHSREEKIARFNSQVLPKVTHPKLYQEISTLHREVINKLVALPEPKRRYYGDIGGEIVTWLNMNIVSTMNGRMGEREFFEEVLVKIGLLNDWLAMIEKFGVFDIDANLRIMKSMLMIKSYSKTELRKIKNKEKKNE